VETLNKKTLRKNRGISKNITILAIVLIILLVGSTAYYLFSQPPAEGIKLKFVWTYPENPGWASDVAADYMAENPNVEIETVTMDSWDMQESLPAWQAAGTLPDITIINQMGVGSLIGMGIVEPLDDYWATYADSDKYIPGTVELATQQGQLNFVPQLVGGTGMVWRRDLVEAAGYTVAEIDTWAEMVEVLEATVDIDEGIYGIPLMLGDNFMSGALFANLANNNGIDWTSVVDNFDEDRDKFIEVFELIEELSEKGLLHPDSYSLEFRDTAVAWGTEGAVAVNMGKFMWGMLGEQTDLMNPDQIYATTMVRGPHGQNTWLGIISGFWISSTSEYKDEAFDFISFANNKYNNAWATATMHDTARTDVTVDYRISNFPELAEEWWLDMWYDAMKADLKTEHPDPLYEPNYGFFTVAMIDVARGDLTPEQAFEQVKADYLDLIP
jgi:ABC-type glycerol-3-phosphate transport system substrate-binding protein